MSLRNHDQPSSYFDRHPVQEVVGVISAAALAFVMLKNCGDFVERPEVSSHLADHFVTDEGREGTVTYKLHKGARVRTSPVVPNDSSDEFNICNVAARAQTVTVSAKDVAFAPTEWRNPLGFTGVPTSAIGGEILKDCGEGYGYIGGGMLEKIDEETP